MTNCRYKRTQIRGWKVALISRSLFSAFLFERAKYFSHVCLFVAAAIRKPVRTSTTERGGGKKCSDFWPSTSRSILSSSTKRDGRFAFFRKQHPQPAASLSKFVLVTKVFSRFCDFVELSGWLLTSPCFFLNCKKIAFVFSQKFMWCLFKALFYVVIIPTHIFSNSNKDNNFFLWVKPYETRTLQS